MLTNKALNKKKSKHELNWVVIIILFMAPVAITHMNVSYCW